MVLLLKPCLPLPPRLLWSLQQAATWLQFPQQFNMSITLDKFSFFFKNINKSHNAVSALLNEHTEGPYNFLFFQEISSKTTCNTADIDIAPGCEVRGLPIHADWTCLPPPSSLLQVAVYCHKQILHRFHIVVDHSTFNHPNIFLFTVCDTHTTNILSFINIYNSFQRHSSTPM